MGQYMMFYSEEVLENHEYYPTKEALQKAIDETESMINSQKQILFGLVCGNAKELVNLKDCEGNEFDPVEKIQIDFNRIFEEDYCGLSYLYYKRDKLCRLMENWDYRYASEFDDKDYPIFNKIYKIYNNEDITTECNTTSNSDQ